MEDLPSPANVVWADPPVTPEMLRDLLQIECPRGAIMIQGIARETKLWPKGPFVYGRLELGGASVRFRAPPEVAPGEGEAVMMRGVLRIEQATKNGENWRATHQVTLFGSVVGTWEARQSTAVRSDDLCPREARTSLGEVMAADGLEKLVIIATDTARRDILQSLYDGEIDGAPEFIEANFGSREEFLAVLGDLRSRRDIGALGIARGGGGGQEIIGDSHEIIDCLNRMGFPYYVALGHASNIWLIDKHADQSFPTPSAFGTAIARAVGEWEFQRREIRERVDLEAQTEELKGRISTLEAERHQGIRITYPKLIFIVSGLIAAFAWALRGLPIAHP
jgi:exodeoxyribonuclease VII large subunit